MLTSIANEYCSIHKKGIIHRKFETIKTLAYSNHNHNTFNSFRECI